MENKNLTTCKACGKEIAKGVKKCPHCGKDQRNFFMKHKIISIIAIFIVLGVIGSVTGGKDDSAKTTSTTASTSSSTESTKSTQADAKKEEEAITVSAVDLAKAYNDNEVSADKQYKGKKAVISGTIKDIGVSMGQTYVVLSSGDDFALTDIQCFFKEQSEIDKVAELSKGSTATIQGKIDGKSMNVGVNDCKLK